MKKFWKATLIPGVCCIVAGLILSAILTFGFADELKEHRFDFSINEDNFFEYFEVDEFMSVSRTGTRYSESETKESYYFKVPEGENITGINFEFAVGEVKIKEGDAMEISVNGIFENAITSEVKNGIWYIEDRLIDSGSVHSKYEPEITITIPTEKTFETMEIYLAAGVIEADELAARQMKLSVDAGSMTVFQLTAENSLNMKNGVGEIRVYDAAAKNLEVDNGIGAISIIGAVSGQNTVKCGIGEVKISLTDRSDVDFNYSIDCGIGEVEVGGKRFAGTVENNSFTYSDADFFALDCGIGHIEIKVNGN